MAIEIKTVQNHRDLMTFIKMPLGLYEGNQYWLPPLFADELQTLSKRKNPAFDFCEAEYFLAYRDGQLVGRIAALINHHAIEKWGKEYGRFGWVEFIEDFEVAKALFQAAEAWLKAKGMQGIHGPMGFTDLDKEGLLIEGFQEMGTMPMIYNHPYYPEYIERLGFTKDVDWLEYEVKVPSEIPAKVTRVQKIIAERTGIHVHEWKTTRELKTKYAKQMFSLIDEAYAGLYGTTALTEKQVDMYIDMYLGFADPRFMKLVVDKDERLIALGLAMPSFSKALQKARGRILPFGWMHLLRAFKNPTGIDLYLVAVRPEHKALGTVAFLMTSLITSCREAGVVSAETSGELETNIEVQSLWKGYERRQHKRRRAYAKAF